MRILNAKKILADYFMSIKKQIKIFIFLFISATLCSVSSFADSFRVRKTHILHLTEQNNDNARNDENYQTTATVGLNDAVSIILPQDLTYIQGIEVNIKIPQSLAKYPNCVIYSLYDSISPVPSDNKIDYTGKEIYTGIYQGMLSLTVQIPLVKNNTIKETPYAVKTLIPDTTSRGFIFIRNQLAMKGMSKEAMESKFIVTAKPVYLKKGKLCLKTVPQINFSDLTLTVDDAKIELDKNGCCFLKSGTHNISVSAEGFRNENRSIIIETAKETHITLDLQSVTPSVKLNMPQGTKVTIDNIPADVKYNSLEITPGEHTFKFNLGGYEVVKQAIIQEGRTYTIEVFLDADINEN